MLPLSEGRLDKFKYSGQFAGFFSDIFGNPRLVLQTQAEELFLGITKPLQTRLSSKLVPGEQIVVTGEITPGARVSKLVSDAWIAGKPALQHCIRVCAKKKCWRNGGEAIWRAVNESVRDYGLDDSISLETVDCLDNCKRGPNLECDGRLLQGYTKADAMDLLRNLNQAGR
jgi:Thioredoxin-like [2Fe-2S] ferredoxin